MGDFHYFESTGELPEGVTLAEYRKTNGFANGKWCLQGPIFDAVVEDLNAGLFCKIEFYTGRGSWWWKIQLEDVHIPVARFHISYPW